MKNEFLSLTIVLMHAMGAQAEKIVPTQISDIQSEVQQCLILAAAPEDRSLLRIAFDDECFMKLSNDDKEKAIQILKEIGRKNFKSIPMIS